MARKEKQEPVIVEDIHHEAMDELMGDRFGIYAKDVIQDRAIPDARDGMKPVQRRIIFAMYQTGNTIDKPTKKCAHIVGEVMGKYHPHGDSSIYDALVRMSQNWRVRLPLVDFQGNNGSMDGDGPAAYRYTEARLAAVSQELVRDIDKDTVDMDLTFDDTDFEPSVLPARFPNLLVNGAEGIAVGLATEIPPHNLREVTSAVIYRINHPTCDISKLTAFIPGPDFPTGGIIYESQGLHDIYTTGRGRIDVASKAEIVDNPDGYKQIIVSEIPYGVIKSDLVRQIDQIRHDKTIAGIDEVRDETDKTGLRIAVDLKDDAKPEAILAYLMSKTQLRSSYSANMVAIVDGRPKTLDLLSYCDTYIAHQVSVITRRCHFDLNRDNARLSIVNGLIKASSIINEVVDVIRHSADKADSKTNLETKFGFTPDQSEAIVMMPLYKLSHTDITTLMNEKAALEAEISSLNGILGDKEKLNEVIVNDLKNIAKQYGDNRRTAIEEDHPELRNIDKRDLVAKEDVMVAVSRDGYVKRSSIASWKGSNGANGAAPGLKSGDTLIYSGQCLTTDFMLLFTNKGNYLYIPVHLIKTNKWLDEGIHVNYAISLSPDEKIVRGFAVRDFRQDLFIAIVTKKAQIKRVRLSDFQVVRYGRPITAMRILSDDEVVDACVTTGNSNLFLISAVGYGIFYNENLLEPSTTKSGGFKAAKFGGKEVAAMLSFAPGERGKVLMLTDGGATRVFDMDHIEKTDRLDKPALIVPTFKSDIENVLFMAKPFDRALPISYVTTLQDGSSFTISWPDLYLTPMERYAKKDDKILRKNMIAYVHRADSDLIDDTIKAYPAPAVAAPVNVAASASDEAVLPKDNMVAPAESKAPEAPAASKASEDNEPSQKFEQISIFGDDFDDDPKK
ncbi:MAG: DNA topoisomerase 4 subunit A [Tenericutes bacterium ADurb.BinA155]|nr:MAG: DNA topoisomerase 4 subunit A [Tenericutes bacterium ADurb.BinA155]